MESIKKELEGNQSFLLRIETMDHATRIKMPTEEELKGADASLKNRFEVLSKTTSGIKLTKENQYQTTIPKKALFSYADYKGKFKIDNFTLYEYLYKLYVELGMQCVKAMNHKFRFSKIDSSVLFSVNNTFQILSVEHLRSEDLMNMEERSFWMISLGKLILYELRRFAKNEIVDEDENPPTDNMIEDYREDLDLIKGTPLYYGILYCLQPELTKREYINI